MLRGRDALALAYVALRRAFPDPRRYRAGRLPQADAGHVGRARTHIRGGRRADRYVCAKLNLNSPI